MSTRTSNLVTPFTLFHSLTQSLVFRLSYCLPIFLSLSLALLSHSHHISVTVSP